MIRNNSLRPGVFSSYTVTSALGAVVSVQYAAVCALALGGEAGKVYRFTSYADAAAIFTDSALLRAVKLLLESGVSQVICVPVGTNGGNPDDNAYEAAFAAIEGLDNIGAVLCDSVSATVQAKLLQSITRSCSALKERIGLVNADNAEHAVQLAQALNSERICLCYPGGFSGACAFAGELLTGTVGDNLSGSICKGIVLDEDNLTEDTVQTLLAAGVVVFETVGNAVECIKAVTTRTKTDGTADYSFANVATVRIIDHILQRARTVMKVLLKNARGNPATMQSIVAQMTVLLSAAVDEGIVSSFATPRAALLAGDPSVCVVVLSFTAATAINQIHIVAHISI
ncbi:hypothetical protein [Hydrogenoanaerobacterium sp.]|uniref:hypothetical protein n=1 Tax=Hydrogenoanaerobacterium sp. TaxID=2953763 RepID=UPI0028A29D3B|nr:hypothetical protein [Hydrogenoanaerobacterium sp.]